MAPAAHYHMGGVDVDLDGRTSVPGLWAAGEVACTGVHGANRLASNSLLEALVFGARVARSVGEALPHLRRPAARARAAARRRSPATTSAAAAADAAIRRVMWEKAGLVRTGDGLREALAAIEALAGLDAAGRRGGAQPRHGGAPRRDGRPRAPREPRRPLPRRPPARRPGLAPSYPARRRRAARPRLETEPVAAPPAAREAYA